MSVISATLGQRRLRVPEETHRSAADLTGGESAPQVGMAPDAPLAVARRLFDLGFTPGAMIERLRRAPLGDPTVYRVDGIEVALRRREARCILVAR